MILRLISILILMAFAGRVSAQHIITRNPDEAAQQTAIVPLTKMDIVWKGTMNKTIPVKIAYQFYGKNKDLVVGTITYLNTKNQQSIPLIGHRYKEVLTLTEYQPSGYNTGLLNIDFSKSASHPSAFWEKPGSDKMYDLDLEKSNTTFPSPDITISPAYIYGKYYYQYGEKGYQGELDVHKTGNDRAAIDLSSVTGAPGRNIAWAKLDTVDAGKTTLTAPMPGVGDCKIRIQFYRHFAVVTYLGNGDCNSQFGANATLEGIYYKIEK